MMNRYEEALSKFTQIKTISLTKNSYFFAKYLSKALDNAAIVKCMSGNFLEAFNLCN